MISRFFFVNLFLFDLGQTYQSRPCNTHICKGEWSCWTDWSDCSVSCGLGEQSRTRECYNAGTKDKAGAYCDGAPIERKPCEMPSCHCKYLLNFFKINIC